LAEIGHEVACSDKDGTRIGTLREGELPIFEPGLDEIVKRNVERKRLAFTSDIGEAIRFGDAIFLCVGTPPLQNGDADLSAIDAAARQIVTEAHAPKLIIEKSTVPTQTGGKLARALSIYARNVGSPHSFAVASNPEFLREGSAVSDFLHPERIVIGVEGQFAESQLRAIYRPIIDRTFACPMHPDGCQRASAPVLTVTNISSAELIKHACNSFLAIKISYANLMADICERIGADVEQVVRAMGLDPRIGPAFLQPGLGFGGYCLPKDIKAFIKIGERIGVDVSLLKAADEINKWRVQQFFNKLHEALWVLHQKRVAILGLAFKPETDDIRCSPALELIRRLLEERVEIRAYDPRAMEKARLELPAVDYCESAYDAVNNADALILATEWDEFRCLDWNWIKRSMANPLIVDGRNFLDRNRMLVLGFEYHAAGKETLDEIDRLSRY
jgi:UDPglucose 6-dehydrogenase